jgi:hypothetical protein
MSSLLPSRGHYSSEGVPGPLVHPSVWRRIRSHMQTTLMPLRTNLCERTSGPSLAPTCPHDLALVYPLVCCIFPTPQPGRPRVRGRNRGCRGPRGPRPGEDRLRAPRIAVQRPSLVASNSSASPAGVLMGVSREEAKYRCGRQPARPILYAGGCRSGSLCKLLDTSFAESPFYLEGVNKGKRKGRGMVARPSNGFSSVPAGR